MRVRAGRQHEPFGLDRREVGPDADAVLADRPLEHALARPQLRPAGERPAHVRLDAALGEQEAAVALEHELDLGRQAEGGEPARGLGSVDLLVREPVLDARANGALEDPRAALERARDEEQLLAGVGLELPPELVRAEDERHVARVLEVRLADDPGEPVRRAALVRNLEALEPEHALPAAGEVVERRAPHAADSDDDDVVALAHGRDPTSPSVLTPVQAG